MKLVYIMRGVPGSGKSTLAKKLAGENGVIHSTDEYFMKDGVYCFDRALLKEYHIRNFRAFIGSLLEGAEVVICDNTNVKQEHFLPYTKVALSYGYTVLIFSLPHPDPEIASRRNSHGVSEETIRKMIAEWEE